MIEFFFLTKIMNEAETALSTNSEQVARRAAKARLVYFDLIETWIIRHLRGISGSMIHAPYLFLEPVKRLSNFAICA